MKFLGSLVFLSLFVTSYSQFVSTSLGTIKGTHVKSRNGVPVEVYKGVPFAKPPIGQLRYAKPEPPNKWKGILDGTRYRPGCLSNSSQTTSPQAYIDEDCLYLNIFTSDTCRKRRDCPVMVYIHGGALLYDSAIMFPDQHQIDHWAARDVILVITAFRLATWGLFASQFEEVTPHNLAIHDIVRSLEFIQSEIHAFGGDPRKVTSLGHSMGADLSLAIAFSEELNAGNRLLAQASAMSPSMDWHDLDRMHEVSFEFAVRAGCTPAGARKFVSPRTTQKIVDCLRTKTWQELLLIQRAIDDDGRMYLNGFPLTHPISRSGSLKDLLKNAPRVPVLLGSTMKEFDPVGLPDQLESFGDILQLENHHEIGIKLFHDQLMTSKLNTTHNYQSQCVYVSTYNYGTTQVLKGALAYLYKYDMDKWRHHTGDLCYVMGAHCRQFDDNEKEIDTIYSEYFVNFAKFGRPTEDWKPLDPKRKNFYSVVVNLKNDLSPHNEEHYEEEVIDYWLKNMTSFDKEVTQIKEEHPEFRVETLEETTSHASFTSIALFLLVLSPGIVLGLIWIQRIPNGGYKRLS